MTESFKDLFNVPFEGFISNITNLSSLEQSPLLLKNSTVYNLTKETLNHNDIFFYFFNTLNTNNLLLTKR